MVATLQIISAHGATVSTTETQVDGGTAKYKRADNDTNDLNNPVPKPSGSEEFSYRKSMRLKATVAPDGDLSNVRWFGDAGSLGTGVTLYGHSKPTANYDQATSADNTVKITTDGGTAVVDFLGTYTSGSPLTMNSGGVMLTNPTTGYGTQDLFESQVGVANTASRGTKGPRTITCRVDET